MKTLNPQIYVALKSLDNPGYEIGAWIDAAQKIEFIERDIEQIYQDGPSCMSRKWAIHAFKDFAGADLFLAQDIVEISHTALFLKEYGSLGAYIIQRLGKLDRCLSYRVLRDYYKGAFSSLREFAQFYIDNHRSLEPMIASVIDYAKLVDALFKEEFVYTRLEDKQFYVFSNFSPA